MLHLQICFLCHINHFLLFNFFFWFSKLVVCASSEPADILHKPARWERWGGPLGQQTCRAGGKQEPKAQLHIRPGAPRTRPEPGSPHGQRISLCAWPEASLPPPHQVAADLLSFPGCARALMSNGEDSSKEWRLSCLTLPWIPYCNLIHL